MIDLLEYEQELELPEEDLEQAAAQEAQCSLFLEYAARDGAFREKRRALAADYAAGRKPLTGPDGVRRALAAVDLGYFGRAYLPHYFVRRSPKFHDELDELWIRGVMKGMDPEKDAKAISRAKGSHTVTAAPRGHAKSTNFTFKDSLHAILYMYKHYILILSDSTDQAEAFLEDIRTELEDNAAILEDFGEQKGQKAWRSGVILTRTDVKVDAVGSGKKIRGRKHRNWRPDLIVLDDIENDENVNTAEQRRKLKSWFDKAVSKAGDTYTDIMYIGTVLHYDSLLSNVLKNPRYKARTYRAVTGWAQNTQLWDEWETIYTNLFDEFHEDHAREFYEEHKAEMLEGTEVLWEDKLSYYDLMEIRVAEGVASFNSELQNDPVDPENATFQEEWFEFYDDAPPDFAGPDFFLVGANDPSLGKNKKSDTSAIIGLAMDRKTGYMYVLDADIARRHPDVIIDDAIALAARYRRDLKPLRAFGVETVQFQFFFKEVMAQRSAEAGEYLPIEEIQSTGNKLMRIESLQPLVKNHYIKFSRRHKTLLAQMTEFPMGRNDDGPDALKMAVDTAMKVRGSTGKAGYVSVLRRKLGRSKGAY